MADLKIADFQWKKAKIENVAKKVLIDIKILPGFLAFDLKEKEMTFLIYTVSFKTIQSIFFFTKWRLLIFLGEHHHPPSPHSASLTTCLNPTWRGTPDFCFHQNDRKGCSLDYLDALGHFIFGFGATGKKFRGVVITLPPPVRRRLNSILKSGPFPSPHTTQGEATMTQSGGIFPSAQLCKGHVKETFTIITTARCPSS